MTEYRYSASNVFARMQSGQLPTELLFDRPHTFAMLDRSGEAIKPAFIELGMRQEMSACIAPACTQPPSFPQPFTACD